MDSANVNTPAYKSQPNFCFKLVESATPEQLAEARKQLLLRGLAAKSSPIPQTQTPTPTPPSFTSMGVSHHSPSQSPPSSTVNAVSSAALFQKSVPSSLPPSQPSPQSHTPTTSPSLAARTPHLSPNSIKRLQDLAEPHPRLSPSSFNPYELPNTTHLRSHSTSELLKRSIDDSATTSSSASNAITFPSGRPRKKACRTPKPAIPESLTKTTSIPSIGNDERKMLEDSQKMLMERQAQVLRLEVENKRLIEAHKTEMEQLKAMHERRIMMLREHHDEEVASLNAKISLLEEVGLQKEVAYREKEKLAEDLKETVEGLRRERSSGATTERGRKGRAGGNSESWKEKFLASEQDVDVLRERVAKLEALKAVWGERMGGCFERYRREQERLAVELEGELLNLTESTVTQGNGNYSFP